MFSLSKYGALIIVAVLLLLFAVRPALKTLKAAARPAEEIPLLGDGTSADRRLAALESGLPGTIPAAGTMMTVGELEAQMSAASPRSADRAEQIRKQLVEQSLSETDMVVSTMRGWLGERA